DLVVDQGAEERAGELEERLLERLGAHVFARDERAVEELVLDLCRARGWSLATAESSTGGMVATRLTSVPGSSESFIGAVVAYSNELKERELGVPAELLTAYGAVSAETAAAMAAGARARLGADVAEVLARGHRRSRPEGGIVPREHLHVTLAFLGHRPREEVEPIAAELRAAAVAAAPIRFEPVRYRETRSVGMLVLDDEGDAAG